MRQYIIIVFFTYVYLRRYLVKCTILIFLSTLLLTTVKTSIQLRLYLVKCTIFIFLSTLIQYFNNERQILRHKIILGIRLPDPTKKFCVQTFSVADIEKYRIFLAFEDLSLRIHLYLLIVYMYIEIVLRSRLCLTSINVFVTRKNYYCKKTWQVSCCENIQIIFPQVLFYFKSIYNYSHVIGWKERYMHTKKGNDSYRIGRKY